MLDLPQASVTHVSDAELRRDLARYLDEAVASRAPITVTRENGSGEVVMIAAEEWSGWMETIHQLASSRNAEMLQRSIAQLDAGQVVEYDPDKIAS